MRRKPFTHVREDGNQIDPIVYPICFDFRHAIELYLKYVIVEFSKVGQRHGT